MILMTVSLSALLGIAAVSGAIGFGAGCWFWHKCARRG